MAEPLNTGLSAQQVLTAFSRSLNDYTDAEIDAMLGEKQDNIPDLAAIRSGATAGSTAVQPAEFETDQARQETEIGVVANAGAKNLLKITASSQTIKGVTFTVNADQTVTVNGTNDGTGASTFMLVPNAQAITIPDGSYILSGCPAGGGDVASSAFDLRWYMYSPGKSAYDIGTGASIEKSGNTTSSNIAIVVKTGQTANNLVFKPMLRRAEITDDTFVPYAPTNRELYETGQSCYDFIFGVGTALQSYDDLNNYKNPGKVQAANGAIATTIANTPWTQSGFTAITIPNLTLTSCMQFVLPNTMAGKWYRRRYMQDTWSPWTEYDGTQVTTT